MAVLCYIIIIILISSPSTDCCVQESLFRQTQKQGILFSHTRHLSSVKSRSQCVKDCLQMASNLGGMCDMIVNRKPSGGQKTECSMYLRQCGTDTQITAESTIIGLQAGTFPTFFAGHLNQGMEM